MSKSFKDELLNSAMKALQSETAQKIMNNETVQQGVARAFRATYEFKSGLDEKREEFARRFNLATQDDLRTMKRDLDRLTRQVDRLKREKAEQAEKDSSS